MGIGRAERICHRRRDISVETHSCKAKKATGGPRASTKKTPTQERMISIPAKWLVEPFLKSLRTVVRPATAKTKRRVIEVKANYPVELFEEFMAPLATGDADGLKREEGKLVPTRKTATSEQLYEYKLKRPAVTDKLFCLEKTDKQPGPRVKEPGAWKRGSGGARLNLPESAHKTHRKATSVSMVAGSASVHLVVPKRLKGWPKLTMRFLCLTADRKGNISWPTNYGKEARALLRKLVKEKLTSADMQGTKALYGMCCSSHSVWCQCQAGIDQQHNYPTREAKDYDDMLQLIEDDVGCNIKTFDNMCCSAHFSPGVARGGRFTRFTCSQCSYSPTEKQWRADLKTFLSMSDDDQKEARRVHNEVGAPDVLHKKHFHQLLFMPPAVHNGMESAGVDQLHLIYLNIFKHLFDHTAHRNLQDSKKELVRNYFKAASFYSYDAAAVDENPTMRWIGREVKRFLEESHIHLPFLLRVAACPPDLVDTVGTDIDGTHV